LSDEAERMKASWEPPPPGYNEEFYRAYRVYLQEKVVRKNHDFCFDVLSTMSLPYKMDVLDLGCGTGEYPTYDTEHNNYAGVDLRDPGAPGFFLKADYRLLSEYRETLPFEPNTFISLFSTECCLSPHQKYVFYNRLFREIPTLQMGMVSGFYYESKLGDVQVTETGGVVSYQTIENVAEYRSEIFAEFRVEMETPSKMFGPDVVEVWKFLKRREET
jgi:hypothetical protein